MTKDNSFKVERPQVSKNLEKDTRKTLSKLIAAVAVLGGVAMLVTLFVLGGKGGFDYKQALKPVEYSQVSASLMTEKVSANSYKFYTDPEAPLVELFEDPACPHCANLEKAYGKDLHEALEKGEISLLVHEINILDGSNGGYSSSVANLYHQAAQVDSGKIYNLREFFFTNQPVQGFKMSEELFREGLTQVGYSAEDTEAILKKVLVEDKPEELQEGFKASVERLSETSGKVGTPTILHGDEVVDFSKATWITDISKK